MTISNCQFVFANLPKFGLFWLVDLFRLSSSVSSFLLMDGLDIIRLIMPGFDHILSSSTFASLVARQLTLEFIIHAR